MTDTSEHLPKIELPSGLPGGLPELLKRVELFHAMKLPGQPMSMHMGTSYLVSDLAKAVKRIPAMVEEIGRLRTQIGDNQALLDAAVAGLADNERLRAQNVELRELIKPISKIPLWRDSYPDGPDRTVGEIAGYQTTIKITPDQVRKARAILAQTEAAP